MFFVANISAHLLRSYSLLLGRVFGYACIALMLR